MAEPGLMSQLVWTARVDVGERVDLGHYQGGLRFMIPIMGGTFTGSSAFPELHGKVASGGADRQWLRPDGVKELDAIYEMQTACGTVLSIHNRVIVDESRQPTRYAMSVLNVTAPTGKFDWLNRRLLVGTLKSLRPQQPTVIIEASILDQNLIED